MDLTISFVALHVNCLVASASLACRYKVEVYRYGSQMAPLMSGGSHERDHYVRYTRGQPLIEIGQSGGRFKAQQQQQQQQQQRQTMQHQRR